MKKILPILAVLLVLTSCSKNTVTTTDSYSLAGGADYDYKQEVLPQEIKSKEKNDNTVTIYEGESEQFTINHYKGLY